MTTKDTMTSMEIASKVSFEIEEGISTEFGNKQWLSKEYVMKCIQEFYNETFDLDLNESDNIHLGKKFEELKQKLESGQ